MRRTYRYDPSRPKGERMVEITPRERIIAHSVIPDVSYQSMVTGEMIGSRSEHREHLKRHDCVEVGNEKPDFRTPEYKPDREQIKHEIRRAKDQIEAGMQPTLEQLRQQSPQTLKELGIE